MEKSIFRFIWKYSKRSQLVLLFVTLVTFPFLYVSLELPKRIINDAIGGTGENVSVLNVSLTQTQFLMVLCLAFLLAVLVNGLIKMRLNTMKGVLAERLLRRFRFQLLSRVMRFPRPYFRTTSQGELVSMVTSEAEPMGGLMGDALSQPVFQAGQMITILAFLFAQSFWFGLASVALIPLQAWLIPRLQRQINLLNKDRIQEVRKLAAEIGETAAGVSDLRINGGMRYRMSLFSDRLGQLFTIRFAIYQKKFFMKFLNNFINQLTPFFFYSVGGFLAIRGDITVGALVAALAAYKDLSSPWKELLAYYNQTQDMALRWDVVTERFAAKPLVPDALFDGTPDEIPSLSGDIVFKNVTVVNEDGVEVLRDINLTIPQGFKVAIKTQSETAAMAFADVLTREVIPVSGSIEIAGHNINGLHQSVIANRIGYAHSKPHIFQGTLGDNLFLPFQKEPILGDDIPRDLLSWRVEAVRAGNSVDPYGVEWLHPEMAGFKEKEDIQDWWFHLAEAMGSDDLMVRRALRSRLEPGTQQKLMDEIVKLRPEISERLGAAGVDDIVYHYDKDTFNPVSPLGSNLLYALPTRMLTQKMLAEDRNFMRILHEEEIAPEMAEISASLIEELVATFGNDGVQHPLFRRLNLEESLYQQLAAIVAKRREVGNAGLSEDELSLMLTVPFAFSAEQIGPAFTEEFKQKVLEVRSQSAARLVAELDGLFATLDSQKYIPVMSVLGNAIFGRISSLAGAREKLVEDVVVDVLSEHGLRRLTAQSIYSLITSQGGENLPAVFRERIAFSRAGIKKPDVLILGNALASYDGEKRRMMRERISELLPNTTKIFIESHFQAPETYDLAIEIVDGRIGGEGVDDAAEDKGARQDLNRKVRAISKAELFAGLDQRQLRLLAFSSHWYKAKAGQVIFECDQEPDAAYLCTKGKAGLYWQVENEERQLVTEVLPGRLVGDMAVFTDKPRQLDLIASEDSMFLRIGASELNAVIENDPMVAARLLKTVAGHLAGAAEGIRAMREFSVKQGVDFNDFDRKAIDEFGR